MKSINMGLNTSPDYDKEKELELEIIEIMERDGECSLSWSCMGRTLHEGLARQWCNHLKQYPWHWEIGYNYTCNIRSDEKYFEYIEKEKRRESMYETFEEIYGFNIHQLFEVATRSIDILIDNELINELKDEVEMPEEIMNFFDIEDYEY